MISVRLACLIHAASVRSEPESNSPFKLFVLTFHDLPGSAFTAAGLRLGSHFHQPFQFTSSARLTHQTVPCSTAQGLFFHRTLQFSTNRKLTLRHPVFTRSRLQPAKKRDADAYRDTFSSTAALKSRFAFSQPTRSTHNERFLHNPTPLSCKSFSKKNQTTSNPTPKPPKTPQKPHSQPK